MTSGPVVAVQLADDWPTPLRDRVLRNDHTYGQPKVALLPR